MAEHPIDLPYRLSLLGTQIYNACQLGGWCFRLSDKHLFYSTFPYEQEFKLFLEASGTLDRAAALADRNTPVILSDPLACFGSVRPPRFTKIMRRCCFCWAQYS